MGGGRGGAERKWGWKREGRDGPGRDRTEADLRWERLSGNEEETGTSKEE